MEASGKIGSTSMCPSQGSKIGGGDEEYRRREVVREVDREENAKLYLIQRHDCN